jgi:hypothetical protein
MEDIGDGRRNLGGELAHIGRWCPETSRHDLPSRGALEWRSSGQHLVHHAGQAVHVGAGIEIDVAVGLFRTHVGWGAGGEIELLPEADPFARFAVQLPRDAEIHEVGVTVLQEYVLRLHVAVEHLFAVGVIERRGNRGDQRERRCEGQATFTKEQVAERAIADPWHHVPGLSGDFP